MDRVLAYELRDDLPPEATLEPEAWSAMAMVSRGMVSRGSFGLDSSE